MRIAVIHDGSDVEVLAEVVRACEEPDLEVLDVDVSFSTQPEGGPLRAGDGILRTGAAHALQVAEERLAGPGIASVSPPGWPVAGDLPSYWRARGLAVRDESPVTAIARDESRAAAARLGGFPLGVRAVGDTTQADLLRVDSLPALFSTLDLLHASPTSTMLGAWEAEPVLWRVLVAEGRARHAGKRVAHGLGWYAPGGAVHTATPPAPVADLAIAGLAATGASVGAVDLLERPDSTLALLHAEAPPPWREVGAWGGEAAHAAILRALIAGVDAAVVDPGR